MASLEHVGTQEIPRNVVELETASAQYRIIYTEHEVPTNPETIRGVDGVVLECVGDFNNSNTLKRQVRSIETNNPSFSPSNRAILKESQRLHTPVFFVDFSSESSKALGGDTDALLYEMMGRRVIEFLEAGLGVAAGAYVIKRGITTQTMTRRDFILGPLAAFLALPFTQSALLFGGDADETSIHRRAVRVMNSVNSVVHPELKTLAIEGRNLLIAQKGETVGSILRAEKGRKPKLGITIGAEHIGIENALKMKPEERIRRLAGYLRGQMSRESLITRVDFPNKNPKEIQVTFYEDRALKETGRELKRNAGK
jgi:hypothetical protein